MAVTKTVKTITQKLNKIQQTLKAPKGQLNKFGNYNYRSCEDILEAVKPLLGDMTLIITDTMIQLGERYYVKATAILSFEGNIATAHAYARESLIKKGMDTAQITGSASSCARKYALNGLFAIDDARDPDTQDNRVKSKAFKTHDTVADVKKVLKTQPVEEIEL